MTDVLFRVPKFHPFSFALVFTFISWVQVNGKGVSQQQLRAFFPLLFHSLELELAGLLPGELLATKVTVASGLGVDGLEEIQLLDDDTGAEIEVLLDNGEDLGVGLGAGTVGVDEDRGGLSNTDGVGELDEGTASETGVDDGLGDPATSVGGRAIDLGPVLARESSTV